MPTLPTPPRACTNTSAALLAAIFAGLAACSSGGGDGSSGPPQGESITAGAFLPDDGLIVVDFESGAAAGSWATESSLAGFTGSSYLTWRGANNYTTSGIDEFGFDFWVEDAGSYAFRIHNRHDFADSTEENDCWVRMDGGDWVKVFSWQRGQWTWVTQHEFSSSNKPEAAYQLSAGNHRIDFSGRSAGFSMDRFHLFDAGVVDPMSTSHPESLRSGVSGLTAGPGSAGMIGASADATSLVSLRATELVDLSEEAWVSAVSWAIPGATYADGTTAASLDPVVVVPGGTALPVRLTISGPDGDQDHWSALNVDGAPAQVQGELLVGGTVELHFGETADETVELRGPAGERLLVQLLPSARGKRVTIVPTSPGRWAYRGRRIVIGDTFEGAFVVAAPSAESDSVARRPM